MIAYASVGSVQHKEIIMIEVDVKRFETVFRRIFEAYVEKSHGFALYHAENSAPQIINKPKGVSFGGWGHLYWFTLVGMSDTRTTSATLYPRFAKMFDRYPIFFQIGYLPTEKRLAKLFKQYQIALPKKQIKFFIERKKHLDLIFGGNPLAIYEGVKTIDELMEKFERIKKIHGISNLFPGAKRKVFTLIALFLSEFTDLEFEDVIPVDVWVQSIANSTNSLSGEGVLDVNKLEQKIRPILTRVFRQFRNHPGASSATWIQGNKYCSNCHRTDMSALCAIDDLCHGPFLRMRHPETGKPYGRLERPFTLRGKFRDIPIVSTA